MYSWQGIVCGVHPPAVQTSGDENNVASRVHKGLHICKLHWDNTMDNGWSPNSCIAMHVYYRPHIIYFTFHLEMQKNMNLYLLSYASRVVYLLSN